MTGRSPLDIIHKDIIDQIGRLDGVRHVSFKSSISDRTFKITVEGGNSSWIARVIYLNTPHCWTDLGDEYDVFNLSPGTTARFIHNEVKKELIMPRKSDKYYVTSGDPFAEFSVFDDHCHTTSASNKVSETAIAKTETSCNNTQTLTKEEDTMTNANRATKTLTLIDNDKGLDASLSLVYSVDMVVENNDVATAKEELLMKDDTVKDAIAKHNAKRVKEINLEILERTGNEVNLREVRLKDLTWEVK